MRVSGRYSKGQVVVLDTKIWFGSKFYRTYLVDVCEFGPKKLQIKKLYEMRLITWQVTEIVFLAMFNIECPTLNVQQDLQWLQMTAVLVRRSNVVEQST